MEKDRFYLGLAFMAFALCSMDVYFILEHLMNQNYTLAGVFLVLLIFALGFLWLSLEAYNAPIMDELEDWRTTYDHHEH